MEWFAMSERGAVRDINEDAYLALPDKGLWAVADGLGGHQAGEVASQLALSVLASYWLQVSLVSLEELVAAVQEANREVYRTSLSRPDCEGMGTTLTAAVLSGRELLWAHVGDSRGYLLRGGTWLQFTCDHTLVAELVLEGQLTAEEAQHHPYRHLLSRALGLQPQLEVEAGKLKVQRGDVLFLCTDGLTLYLDPEDVLRVVQEAESLAAAGKELIAEALRRGGEDNITLVMVRIDD
ncbi:Stp1/IreP family PP2C-type Ser/Thr phosphatase [Desulfothermobacter acidiphilus]|uniref:Stp1/IreP family PP2C-type Ser/Thr phosphatase n=1 Tax=Desulfothermobacter acidiphilus TaxID=1938353 RepID=UPI003F88A2C4